MARNRKNKKRSGVSVSTTVTTGSPVQGSTNMPNSKKKKGSKRSRGKGRRSVRSSVSRERSFFDLALLAPSVTGPFRQPRQSSARTGVGQDLNEAVITGSATNIVQGAQLTSQFSTNSMTVYAVTGEGTALGAGTAYPVSAQFPLSTQVADVNCTSAEMILYYTGNPLNVQGEVIVGACLPISSTATYSSLYVYPGTQRFPVAELIQRPKRIALRKLSPVCDEFVPVNTALADADHPFCLTSGLPTGGTLKILVIRTWEYRSTTSAGGLVIPYEKVGSSYSSDLAAFQDARADIATLNSTVTDAVPEGLPSSLGSLIGLGAAGGLAGLVNHMYNTFHRQRNQSRYSGGEEMFDFASNYRDFVSRGELV